MTRSFPSSTHDRRSGAARLVRLAAAALLALAIVGSAVVWAQTTNNRCIHHEVQQNVLRSVAPDQSSGSGTLSAVGLPVVAIVDNSTDMSTAFDSMGSDSTQPNVTRSNDWGELRITVFTDNFTDPQRYCKGVGEQVKDHRGSNVPCTTTDILTEDKRDMLMNSILPEAVRLHTERLRVKQVRGSWKVSEGQDNFCGLFNVSREHAMESFNNTDFLLYVASVPSDAGVVSWGATCQVFPDGQPAVGVINVPADKIVSRHDQRVTRVVAHQIAHALGFSNHFFETTHMKNSSTELSDERNIPPVIKGNKTVTMARKHYGCESLQQLEMEKRLEKDSQIFHFLTRNAKDELMAPEVGAGYYSALTMAIFEDTGFYQANFSKAEVMTWGRNASCDFLNNTCKDNNITKWPQMFCNRTEPGIRCTSSRLDIGKCGVHLPVTPWATAYQYFNTEEEHSSPALDSCPYVEAPRNGACNLNSSTASGPFVEFNVFSDAARCIDGAFAPKNNSTKPGPILGVCANIKCDNATNRYSVQVKGSNDYVNCTEGHNITLGNVSDAFEASGYITCPPYVEVCQGNVKAVVDFKADLKKNKSTSSGSGRGDTHTDSLSSSGQDSVLAHSLSSSGQDSALAHSMTSSEQDNALAHSMPSSGPGHTPTDSMPSSGQGHTPTDSMPSSGQDSVLAHSMPSSGSGANKPDATSSNGKGDSLNPRGNGAAGLRSTWTLVSAGVALLMVTLTVGLSA